MKLKSLETITFKKMAAATCDVSTSNDDRMKDIKEFARSKVGVKGLIDSGIASIPKIFIQPPETLSTLNPYQTNTSIPVIDLENITSQAHRPKLVQQIKEAASEWGFFQVINHGIPVSLLEETIEAVKSFHEQPKEIKAKYYSREERSSMLYSSNNDLYRAKAATWHDYLQIWMSPKEQSAKVEDIPEILRKESLEWDCCAKKVAEDVMELLCEGIGLESSKFKDMTLSGARLFVGIYYPYCPQPNLTLGLTSHTDSTTLTVLLQNQVSGLQVKHGEEWVDVKPLPGALIINIGDLLQIISNGEYNSVQHRARANSCEEPRISVVEFLNFSKWEESGYGPLPELVSAEKPPRYRQFTTADFVNNFYSKGLDSKSLVDKLKL
ncbi:1-aminocyclopropane-1-carboxylate oxidase homolog 4-like [Durio zibethinus]|uniref:1-aminocyclopropane-1-carboxylate oxidase homolog 4-like n=1 Tax=Durio zibethinus TaxID=66656 RepID=A0A6P5YZT5_DURZI|nr:1-aminocyclopropane-1-carboxylate oxidase homolog 4-like [Durio zibethinus]